MAESNGSGHLLSVTTGLCVPVGVGPHETKWSQRSSPSPFPSTFLVVGTNHI